MKRIFFLFVLCALFCQVNLAQVINGDLNHNDNLDVEDVTLLIDGYLTGEAEVISNDPFAVDNSRIVGTWYKSTTESITFREDGTTDYLEGYTYQYLPMQGRVFFFNSQGEPVSTTLHVPYVTSQYLAILHAGSDNAVFYSSTQPASITLSRTSLRMKPNSVYYLTATVEPSDAGTIAWSSSDENVATVWNGKVTAIANGTAVITAEVAGSTATCTVTVFSKTYNNGYEYVDLGLPSGLKWATMNVGATTPEYYGDYFAWGETTPKDIYTWENYTLCKGSKTTMTKYCTDSSYGTVDNKSVLDPEDDAAHVNWGGTWRMPTHEEQDELIWECTWTWITQNGVNGRLVTGPNGNSIFLPAAGYRDESSLNSAGSYVRYWSSSLGTSSPNYARFVSFNWSDVAWGEYNRYCGYTVRAVCP